MGERPRSQAIGTPMSQSMKGRDADEIALHGTTAVVQDVAGHPAAVGGCAPASGARRGARRATGARGW